MINNEELLNFNLLGLIPGPTEKEEPFKERCAYCLNLKKNIKEKIPFSAEDFPTEQLFTTPFKKTKKLFDIVPSWIPLFFSNYKLTPWHGGCAWIFQEEEKSPTGAFFQLRQSLRHSPTYLGLYDRDELIAHELSHVGRMQFEEPQFEEVLAYRTSNGKLRRYWGPIVQSPWESAFFVLALLLIFMLDLFFLFQGSLEIHRSLLWLKLIPLALLAFGMGRVILRQHQIKKCLKNLTAAVRLEEKANAILYRLKDSEIKQFGKMTPPEIWKYMIQHKDESLRWRLLSEAYFKD